MGEWLVNNKFGWVLKLDTGNLGDEIQSVAARRFLPTIDIVIDRERPDLPLYSDSAPIKAIMNGWFAHRPEFWPPHASIIPLITSFHLSREITTKNVNGILPPDAILSGESLEYLRAHAPIGARDNATRDLMHEKGVDSYFSGCLTLTLDLFQDAIRDDYICLVDVTPEVQQAVRQRTRSKTIAVTHHDWTTTNPRERIARAEDLLRQYASARCVVTSRLHCALPCLALGTPVLLVMEQLELYRFSGLRELVHHCVGSAVIDGTVDYVFDRPPPNPETYLGLRRRLISQCSEFFSKNQN